jgi:hypothetical protein
MERKVKKARHEVADTQLYFPGLICSYFNGESEVLSGSGKGWVIGACECGNEFSGAKFK